MRSPRQIASKNTYNKYITSNQPHKPKQNARSAFFSSHLCATMVQPCVMRYIQSNFNPKTQQKRHVAPIFFFTAAIHESISSIREHPCTKSGGPCALVHKIGDPCAPVHKSPGAKANKLARRGWHSKRVFSRTSRK